MSIIVTLREQRLADAVTRLRNEAAALEQKLNDPRGDGTGEDSKAPDGDDYNALLDIVNAVLRDAGFAQVGS